MPDSTLSAIRTKVRRLSGNGSESQLTTPDLDQYIDTFYEQDLPSHLKLWNLHDVWTFFTEPNEDRYLFPVNEFYSINPPIYVDGYQSFYSQSREEFFRIYPKLSFQQTGPTGTGIAGPYNFNLTNVPVLKRDVTIYADDGSSAALTIEDDGEGNLVDVGTTTFRGTIDYVTGAVSVTFSAAIPATEAIKIKYVPYQASRPAAALFFKNYLRLRPVPDQVYRVTAEVYRKPTQLLASSAGAEPDIQQWWQLIAFGAARKVLQDRLDNEALASIEPFYQEQMNLVLYRTATQLSNQRTATIFTEQLQFPAGNRGFPGFS
jgi:hypothetical protein